MRGMRCDALHMRDPAPRATQDVCDRLEAHAAALDAWQHAQEQLQRAQQQAAQQQALESQHLGEAEAPQSQAPQAGQRSVEAALEERDAREAGAARTSLELLRALRVSRDAWPHAPEEPSPAGGPACRCSCLQALLC